jgi:hypothetical protein
VSGKAEEIKGRVKEAVGVVRMTRSSLNQRRKRSMLRQTKSLATK